MGTGGRELGNMTIAEFNVFQKDKFKPDVIVRCGPITHQYLCVYRKPYPS